MSLVYVLSLDPSWICSGEGSSRGPQPADASNKNSPRGKRRETNSVLHWSFSHCYLTRCYIPEFVP